MDIIEALREGPEHQRQHEREARAELGGLLFEAAHQIESLYDALSAITEWAREHTSPRDPNSPHEILIEACATIAAAKADYQPRRPDWRE